MLNLSVTKELKTKNFVPTKAADQCAAMVPMISSFLPVLSRYAHFRRNEGSSTPKAMLVRNETNARLAFRRA
ncbi:hypothetical protein A1D31_38885 [Bradyrhizobium liaoningense]|nr:hypothetical protein A1D31_38885 [Bradyrhizobium liaoningense]